MVALDATGSPPVRETPRRATRAGSVVSGPHFLAHEAVSPGNLDWVSLAGTTVLIVCVLAYVAAAATPSRVGRRWPARRTVAFLAGAALVQLSMVAGGGSGADDDLAAHVAGHLVLMMAAAPLLVAGGPLRLLLRSLPRRRRMAMVEVLQDPAVRSLTAGRFTAVFLVADYYGSMAVYLLTPLQRWSTEHLWLHIGAHVYFLTCGALFWVSLHGRDATGWRPRQSTRMVMTLVGVPLLTVLGYALMVRGEHAAGWVMAIGGSALSVAAAVAVAYQQPLGARAVRGVTIGELSWRAAS